MDSVRAMFVDVGGTLLQPVEPVARTYARIGRAYGVTRSEALISGAFGRAFRTATGANDLGRRYVGDGRPFWRTVVAEATGVKHTEYFEALYAWFGRAEAWRLAPGAKECCEAARAAGLRVVVASNWDTRLRPLLTAMGALEWLDALAISCEVGVEKPDPGMFLAACELGGVAPTEALHIGNDPVEDGAGARAAGVPCWLLGRDVEDFAEVQQRLLAG